MRTTENFNGAPSYLPDTQERFDEAIEIWKNAVNETAYYLIFIQNTSDGIEFFFSEEDKYFSNPATQGAFAQSCVANNRFVNSCTENEAQLKDATITGRPWVTRAR